MSVTDLVAANIKKIRMDKKFSQEKLAEYAGCSKNHISAIERGKKYPSAALMDKLVEILDVKPFHFFLDNEDTKNIRIQETVISYVMDSIDKSKLGKYIETGGSANLID